MPNILALGYSYTIGQTDWAHTDAPAADSVHSQWPDRSLWAEWLTEMSGMGVPAGPNLEHTGSNYDPAFPAYPSWYAAPINVIENYLIRHTYNQSDINQYGFDTGNLLAAAFSAVSFWGALPHDVSTTNFSTKDNDWDKTDGVEKELHIYYFTFDYDSSKPGGFNISKRLQILGIATQGDRKDHLILPTAKGVDIPFYIYTGNNNWIHDITAMDWTLANWPFIATVISTVVAIITTILTWGTATAAVVGAELILVEAITSAAEALIYSALSGDTTGLFKNLINIVLKVIGEEIKANAGDSSSINFIEKFKADNPEIYKTISNIGDSLSKIYDEAKKVVKDLELDVNSIILAVNKVGGLNLQPVTGDVWTSIKNMIPATTQHWFLKVMNLDPTDPNLYNQIANIESATPDYAKETLHLAVTLKVIESVKTNIVFKSHDQIKVDRPGGGVPGSSFAPRGIASIFTVAPSLGSLSMISRQ
jgi:hypothetical protein